MELFTKTCIPCQGGETAYTKQQARDMMVHIHPDWTLEDRATKITRQFKFKDFKKAMAMAVTVGEIAEDQWHHPDMEVGWGRLVVTITTHKIHGLVESDFIFAAKVDKAFETI